MLFDSDDFPGCGARRQGLLDLLGLVRLARQPGDHRKPGLAQQLGDTRPARDFPRTVDQEVTRHKAYQAKGPRQAEVKDQPNLDTCVKLLWEVA
ncbi:MAG: hypothetical protein ACRDYA_20760 [Egibacteraceae bacterium]